MFVKQIILIKANFIIMKKLTLIFIFLSILFSSRLHSQINPAVDFTVTDIDGNVHNLFTYLDAGKHVYLDFFFIGCPSCEAGIPMVNNIYNSFGCNASQLVVIGIESTVGDAALQAFRDQNNVDFPIVSGTDGGGIQVDELYQISEWPTYLLIKPDRSVIIAGNSVIGIQEQGLDLSACPGEMPIANFSATPLVLPAGDSVFFTNMSNQYATQWFWEFPGAATTMFSGENPGWIQYNTPGLYNVKLTVSNDVNNTDSIIKINYIDVKIPADTFPVAAFTANQIVVLAGGTVNFTDLTTENPWWWEWSFFGAVPNSSNFQNPTNIRYNNPGTYDVRLIVRNSFGYDTIVYHDYIHVIANVGTERPIARFSADKRLIKRGTKVHFTDESDNYPVTWSWVFQGGTPNYGISQIVPGGVLYNSTGYFDVTLNVSNSNGASVLQKKDYIVVYNSYVGQICDTVANVKAGETPYAMSFPGGTGYYGGQNSDKIEIYADHFKYHTYNKIYGIIIPLVQLQYANNNAYIRLYVWDGADDVPTNEIVNKRVYLRDLQQNFNQVIMFDQPLEIDGPFYLGYSVNNISTEKFVVGLVSNRGINGDNTLFVRKNGEWYNSKFEYQISTSTGIKPMVCLVGIEDEFIQKNLSIYPNPANNIVYVSYENYFRDGDFVELFDITGKTLSLQFPNHLSNEISFDVSNLSSGVYYMRIFVEGKILTEKISIF